MARDVSDTVRDALGSVVREAIKNAGDVKPGKKKSGPLSGAKGIARGHGARCRCTTRQEGRGRDPVDGNGIPGPTKLAGKAASNVGDKVADTLKDTVSSKVDEAGGAGGLVKEAASGLLPFGGGGDDGGGKGGVAGVGKGRRMPVQQAVDVAVPIETAYNQFTQWEDWSTFMHRVTNVSQDDPCSVKFSTKIWTRKREFTAEIDTQRPDERIKWHVSQGITHTGVVTFHELAPRLTRIELNFDVEPGGMIEKMARGMRHVKRAARADLHRFKAFIEMAEQETGAWRGVIEDGELVEDHPRPTTRSASTPTSRTSSRRRIRGRGRRRGVRRGVRRGRQRRRSQAHRALQGPGRAPRRGEQAAGRATIRPSPRRAAAAERARPRPGRARPAAAPAAAASRGKAPSRRGAAGRPAAAEVRCRECSRAQSPSVSKVRSHPCCKAMLVALVAGIAAAVLTYRLMRS